MAFQPTSDIQFDADCADLKTKKNVYNAAVSALAAEQVVLNQKQAAVDSAKAALLLAETLVENDAITFRTF
jgi:hypothetical protein